MACRDVWNTWHEGLRAPQNPTAKPEGFVATGGPRATAPPTRHGQNHHQSAIILIINLRRTVNGDAYTRKAASF